VSIKLGGLPEGYPDRSCEVLCHGAGPQREYIDPAVGLSVVAEGPRDSSSRVFSIPGLDPRSHTALEVAHDLIRDSSVDVLLFNSLHNFSPLRAGEQPHPLVAELFCRGRPSRHRAAVLWLARASLLTAGRDASAKGFRGGDEVRTRRGKGDQREG
jgi:hypothetical protein